MALPAVVLLTGAGISRESGLATFRDPDGLWSQVRIEDVATPEAFARDPDRVLGFYDARRQQARSPDVSPNAAHLALAELDRRWSGDFLLITQNVDDLHDRAGSHRLLHMHGELARDRCTVCGGIQQARRPLITRPPCVACSCRYLRPHIVWFGEMPFEMERIYAALRRCDLFVSIGTSGNVYPAAGFVAETPPHAHTVELNLETSAVSALFHEVRHGPASQLVPAFVAELLRSYCL